MVVRVSRTRAGLPARAPIAQLAEAADLKSAQCRFESDWGHGKVESKRSKLTLASRLPLSWKDGDPNAPGLVDRIEAMLRGQANGAPCGFANRSF